MSDLLSVERANWRVDWEIMKWSYSHLKSADVLKFAEAGATADQLLRMGVAPDGYYEDHGNLLLNAGITRIWNVVTGNGGTAFNAANSRIGVGDSSTAESASQTDLQAPTNKYYMTMDSTFPSVSAQTATWRATFGTSVANFAWAEWIIDNGTTANTTPTAPAMNRKVATMGTKASGATWTLQVSVTLS